MPLTLLGANRFSAPEIFVQKTSCVFLGLVVAGLEQMKIIAPDGRVAAMQENCALQLIPEQFQLDFRFNRNRENFVIFCRIPELSWDVVSRKILLRDGDLEAELRCVVPLEPARLPEMRNQFQKIVELANCPMPVGQLAARMILQGLLAEFILSEGHASGVIRSAAAHCKKCFDEDLHFKRTFRDIAREEQLSEVHLRRLFREAYQIDPSRYRARLRLMRISELLASTDLPLKEIAEEAGMKIVTHLHCFIRSRCGMTATELRQSFHRKTE
ncbi:MAG: helix-turn-helix transcriptional regulator [Victivallaceae bacterium]|nr:helix-turn-helix transcriptional regulator [Victivallaceae bacterium]